MSAAHEWRIMAVCELETPLPELWEEEWDLWPYRDRTVALLKRYARLSVEVGRLPSLLGREFFRTRVTSYSMGSFEDVVVFVLDMEMALETVEPFERKLIAMNVLEEYSQAEIARLMGCTKRWLEYQVPEAIDAVSRALLRRGLMDRIPHAPQAGKSCQEGETVEIPVSDSNDGENIF